MVNYDVVNIPIVDIVNQIILYASKNRASDIHMDPHEDHLLIRMRIDGELHDHTKIPKAYERNLVTRVKLISNMNITETRLPQDGNIRGNIEGRDLDMRVSVLPTNEGEKVVIRILDYSKSLDGIESLGFSDKNFELLKNMLSVPNGIILVTGATGSGKSTTTYSMLQALNNESTNIITVEDPVEMNIEGINQVHVNSEIGLTFAAALRSILRQDPNVILIGEIRDSETAQIAVRASITGHLVLSTIHTNNSLNTIERLLDMDVERYLLSSALTGIISQKLARKLCDKCKVQRKATDYEKEIFKIVLNQNVDYVYDAGGCPECTQGYKGRIALQEVLYISDELRNAIADENTTKDDLKVLVYSGNVTTLLGDGLEKIIKGVTTFSEIFKLIEVDLEMRSLREDTEKIRKKKEEREREERERIEKEKEEIERVERTRAEIKEKIEREKEEKEKMADNKEKLEKEMAEIERVERARAKIKEEIEKEKEEKKANSETTEVDLEKPNKNNKSSSKKSKEIERDKNFDKEIIDVRPEKIEIINVVPDKIIFDPINSLFYD
ncbi:MAG: GspE/PulE family protein [bacterium]|nr:GspE/PulE family protein [bacterium]